MKKALFVYYSFQGNVRYLASEVAKSIPVETEELQPQRRLPEKNTLMTMLHGGKSALAKESALLKPLKFNPDEFEIIILGWPLWAWTLPPAMRDFLKEHTFKNKQILLVVSSSSMRIKKCVKEVEQILAGNRIEGVYSFRDPLKHPQKAASELNKLIDKVKELIHG